MEKRRWERPRTRMTGVVPRRLQVREVGGVIENPASSSKTIQPRAPARCFHVRPHLLHPAGHRGFVALEGTLGRHLMTPAMPTQRLRDPRQRHRLVKTPADQGLDPGQSPSLVRPAMRDRPLGQLLLEHDEQRVAQLRTGRRATRTNPALTCRPPGLPPPLDRPDADP